MTYKITKNKFDIQNGTAQVTVHLKYIDGTNIYAATIQEYTRKVAVAAYAGKTMTQDDIQEMLASLLTENASTADEKYSDIDITIRLSRLVMNGRSFPWMIQLSKLCARTSKM